MISFPNFEGDIPKKLISRGFDYYEQDQVEEVEVLDDGEFSAIVQGTEEYEVYIKLGKNKVENQTCTCPYFEDWDNVCKHIVAVLYYIRDAEMHKEEYTTNITEEIKDLLAETKSKELRDFVLEYAKTHRDFRKDLFAEFG